LLNQVSFHADYRIKGVLHQRRSTLNPGHIWIWT